MNNETTNEEVKNEPEVMTEEKWEELLKAVHHNGYVALKMNFKEVAGQVLKYDVYGPVFVYHVKDDSEHVYSCGFFLRELINRFQTGDQPGNNPAIWMASFFIDLMKEEGGKTLPQPVTSDEEAKAVIDNVLVPHCIEAVREEFAPEQVHAGLSLHEEHGPVFEVGFPDITEGNNVCAVPLNLLLTHLQLNRDPAELLLQGLYGIRKQHEMD